MKKILCLLPVLMLMLSGCAVKKDWAATGGSRADATVRLSYQYGGFEQPVVDEAQALAVATQRCQSWGYTSAEAFGGVVVGSATMNGKEVTTVTKEFQCIGKGDAEEQAVETAKPKRKKAKK